MSFIHIGESIVNIDDISYISLDDFKLNIHFKSDTNNYVSIEYANRLSAVEGFSIIKEELINIIDKDEEIE